MKKIRVIFVIIVVLLLMFLNTSSYAKTEDEIFIEISNMTDPYTGIDYNTISKYLSELTDSELKCIVNGTKYSNQYQAKYAEIPEGNGSRRVNVYNLALDEQKRRNNTTSDGNTGAQVDKDAQKAAKKAEEIKEAYNKLGDIENASTNKLKEISNMINELVQLDGMQGQYYKSIETINVAIYSELEQRKETSDTAIDQEQTVVKDSLDLQEQTGQRDPEQDKLASYKPNEKTSPDEIIGDASDFLNTGKNNQGQVMVNGNNVQKASNMLFNVLFTIAIAASILIGIYLGIKFMMSSAEDKASIKESLLPYFVGVVVMFASFSIWRLVLVLMQSIDKI